MNNKTNTLIGFVSGLATGIALGVLFAPNKGSSTRGNLAFNAEYFGEVIKEKAFEIKDDIKHIVSEEKENIRA